MQGTKGTDGKSAGMRYIYLGNTGNFRPGATYFATNNATIANVTQIYIDYWDFYGERLDALLRTFDDSTSPIKGILYFNSLDNAKPGFGVFAVNSLVDNANYFVTLNVSFIAGSNLSVVTDMAMLFTRSGDQGGAGIQGTQGIQGRQGIQGLTGAGTQGTTGIQGYTGIQGLQGTQGLQGSQGTTGIQGILGIQGFQGLQGIQGFLGLQGFYGVQGLTGAQGLQGIKGDTFWRRNSIQNIGLTDDYDKVSIGASSNPNGYKLNVWGSLGVSGETFLPGIPAAAGGESKVVLWNPTTGKLGYYDATGLKAGDPGSITTYQSQFQILGATQFWYSELTLTDMVLSANKRVINARISISIYIVGSDSGHYIYSFSTYCLFNSSGVIAQDIGADYIADGDYKEYFSLTDRYWKIYNGKLLFRFHFTPTSYSRTNQVVLKVSESMVILGLTNE